MLPVKYNGIKIDAGYRVDMLVAEYVIIENKSVQEVPTIHEAQLLTLFEAFKVPAWISRELERPVGQRRHQAHGESSITN